MLSTLRGLWPEATAVTRREQWRAAIGALLGIALTGALSQWLGHDSASGAWLIAPMGASAVLLFALPASPLTQPWSVIGGNTLSALLGLAMVQLLPDPHVAAGLTVAVALLLMFALRCLHPPGGAVALLTVLTRTQGWDFAFFPVMVNSALLVLMAVVYNRLTGRAYPHPHAPQAQADPASLRLSSEDLDAALRRYDQVLDVDREDLQALLFEAQAHAQERSLGRLRCRDIMSRQLVTVGIETSVQEAQQLLEKHAIKALPVVDAQSHVIGILSRVDVFRHQNAMAASEAPPSSALVRQVMTRQVRVAREDTRLLDLLSLFSHEGHHHLPIVDEHQVLVGMVTQSDLIRALHRSVA